MFINYSSIIPLKLKFFWIIDCYTWIWRAYFQKGLDPFSIKFELLISQHYSFYPLPLKHISDPNVTSKKKIL